MDAGSELLQRSLALGRDLFNRGFLTVEQAQSLMQRLHAGEAGGDLLALLRETEGLPASLRAEVDRLATLQSGALSGRADSGPIRPTAVNGGVAGGVSDSALPPSFDSGPSGPIQPVPGSAGMSSQGSRGSGPGSQSRSGAIALPDQVGPWQTLGPLGEGGMGAVYRARHTETGQLGALKWLPSGGERARERFRREALALSAVDHDNVVRRLDSGDIDGHPWLVMELIEGESLEALAKTSPAQRRLTRLFAELADGLEACHRAGLVHRDLKPANVVVRSDDRPVLVDFGLIRSLDPEGLETLTATGEAVGTPQYMAPEQIDPDRREEQGPATDLWAFGATLFHGLTGLDAFAGSTRLELFAAISGGRSRNLRQAAPDLPVELAGLIKRCLSVDAGRRPTAAEAAEVLRGPMTAPKSRRGLIAGALVLLLLIGSVTGVIVSLPPAAIFVELAELPAITAKTSLPIHGRISHPGLTVLVQDQEVKTDEAGAFATRITLEEGERTIALSIPGSRADRRLRTLTVTCDTTAPVLALKDLEDKTLKPDEGLIGEGTVHDAHKVTLTLDGEPVPVDREGRFTFACVDSRKVVERLFVAVDPAGNRAELAFKVLGPRARKRAEIKSTRKNFGEVLYDRKGTQLPTAPEERGDTDAEREAWAALAEIDRWRKASPAVQDTAIRYVAARVHRLIVFDRAEVFGSGKHQFRIGVFKHEATGCELSLIPGGWNHFPVDPAERRLYLGLRALSRGAWTESELRIVTAVLPVPAMLTVITGDEALEAAARKSSILGLFKSEELRKRTQVRFAAVAARMLEGARANPGWIAPVLVSRFEISEGQWASMTDGELNSDRSKSLDGVPFNTGPYTRLMRSWRPGEDRGRPVRLLEVLHILRNGSATGPWPADAPEDERDRVLSEANSGGVPQPIRERRGAVNALGVADLLGHHQELYMEKIPSFRGDVLIGHVGHSRRICEAVIAAPLMRGFAFQSSFNGLRFCIPIP